MTDLRRGVLRNLLFQNSDKAVKLCEVHVATALMLHDILLETRES